MPRLTVRPREGGVELVRRWSGRHSVWPAAVFASTAFVGIGSFVTATPGSTPMLVGRLFIAGLALLSGYWLLTHLVNRSVVVLDAGQVEARHGPLPTPGARALPRTAVDRFRVRYTRRGQTDGEAYYEYEVLALHDDDEALVFIDRDQAVAERAVEVLSEALPGSGT